MKIGVKKNWGAACALIAENPVVLMPTLMIGFIEFLCLELIYFFPRPPLMYLIDPVVRKFFGEVFIHYPGNMLVSMKLVRGAEMFVYVFAGALLYAVTIIMVKDIAGRKTPKLRAGVTKAVKRYAGFFLLGALLVAVFYFEQKLSVLLIQKGIRLLVKFSPAFIVKAAPHFMSLALFLNNVVLTVFTVLVLPFMVIRDLSIFKAFVKSLVFGMRGFWGLFVMILVPYLLHLPMLAMKSFPVVLAGKTFPEVIFLILAADIIVVLAVEAFVVVSVSLCVINSAEGDRI
ncbi:MAG: hypothetical protein HQL30_09730 [Candidatus Omnitrophica bacterium]|nr:hypothetical protein [Candidatus Omnitrophota bacterium]